MSRKQQRQVDRDEMKEYGELFKSMRQSIGFTQKRMAQELDVFFTTVYRWEKGERIPQEDIYLLKQKYREVVKKYNGKK